MVVELQLLFPAAFPAMGFQLTKDNIANFWPKAFLLKMPMRHCRRGRTNERVTLQAIIPFGHKTDTGLYPYCLCAVVFANPLSIFYLLHGLGRISAEPSWVHISPRYAIKIDDIPLFWIEMKMAKPRTANAKPPLLRTAKGAKAQGKAASKNGKTSIRKERRVEITRFNPGWREAFQEEKERRNDREGARGTGVIMITDLYEEAFDRYAHFLQTQSSPTFSLPGKDSKRGTVWVNERKLEKVIKPVAEQCGLTLTLFFHNALSMFYKKLVR